MDRNTIIGFVLIALVMIGFMWMNQPSKEQVEAQRRYNDSIMIVENQKAAAKRLEAKKEQDSLSTLSQDTASLYARTSKGTEQMVTLKNKLVSIKLSNLGGRICSATLADYKNQQGQPVTLFSEGDSLTATASGRDHTVGEKVGNEFYFTFDGKQENINTKELFFTVTEVTDSTVTMSLPVTANGGTLDFKYRLLPESYMVDLTVEAHGLQDFFPSSTRSFDINWSQLVRQQEKGFSFEQRYTTLTYKVKNDDTDYLKESTKDSKNLDKPIDWIAFKNQFFSCIFIADADFNKVQISSVPMVEGSHYMKDMTARMSTYFDPTGAEPSNFQFYFGPNRYKTLTASSKLASSNKDLQLHNLIYFGWPIFRWINRYFIMYLFDWLTQWGLNMGVVLLLLTLIVKAVVYPFTYKSFLSSAKMRALKPYVDEINAKYPKKEDAMKKQQEVMTMYSRFGVSPMGGCLPMLIQMPIWIALFNFVPNAIELRQQSFLWAPDLSTYDNLIHWNASIPLLGNHLSLFCLLFCITNVLNTVYSMKQQQAMTGQQEQQMKMMKWMMYLMPVIFVFMLNDYSSGLNYYYFVSGLISILTFVYLRKAIDEKKLLAKLEARFEANKNNPVKKSNLMAKMEALQKEQERRNAEMQKKKK